MAANERFSLCFSLNLFCLLLHINSSLSFTLKNCIMLYQEDPSVGASLDCADRKLMTVPDDLPKHVVSIQLHENQLQKISKNAFLDMTKLRFLGLDYNQISSVDDGAFVDLVLLKTLYMHKNNLSNLTKNMFQGLSNLTELNLSNNEIQLIHDSTFQFLISLQTLDLSENMLQQVIDIKPILQLPQIQTLKLKCSQFTSFDTKDLQLNCSSTLKELRISGRNLEKFSITTPNFPHLQILDFSTCRSDVTLKWDIPDKTFLSNITDLLFRDPVFSFEGLQEVLQSLDSLSDLSLTLLDEWVEKGILSIICNTATLRRLYLLNNNLETMSLKLAPCSQLTELVLKKTSVKQIPEGSIQSMKQLRILRVSENQLVKVPFDIRSLASIEILTMSDNLLNKLRCHDFMNTTNLSELYLSENRITQLDKCVFKSLTNLKLLDLSNNPLTTVTDTFNNVLQKLEVLNISHSYLKCIKNNDFAGLESLKQLKMETEFFENAQFKALNGLNNLEELAISLPLDYLDVRELKKIKNLRLHLNSFPTFFVHNSSNYDVSVFTCLKLFKVMGSNENSYTLPVRVLQGMKNLERLEVANVDIIAENRDVFQLNSQLKSLTLTQLDLSDLNPEIFQLMPNLQILDLSETHLQSLEFLVEASLTALTYLKMSNNEIIVINETVFSSLPSLTYLDLSNNPFSCECSNSGFIQWVKNNKQTQVVNAHEYKCSFPVDKRETLLLDFDVQPCLDNGSFFFFISSTCLVVLTLLTSFIYHFLKWHLVYTYHLFLAFLDNSWKGKKQYPHQFDAFVSYNVHDEDWVYREMLPVLEGEQGWRLCLHHRDFQPGKPIIQNITDAIYGSRKTICVISRHYLQSEWCTSEIQMASFRQFDEQKDVLILLFLEQIPRSHLSPYHRLRKLVKKQTYLSWPQTAQHRRHRVFWQNVQRALQTGDALTENTDLLAGARNGGN